MFEAEEQRRLLLLARQSIAEGLACGKPLQPELAAWPEPLREKCGNFVTLTLAGQLRGCIGSLEEDRPLVVGIAANAYNAAFRDPRFPAVSAPELEQIEVEISVLSSAEPLSCSDEADALAQLQPHVDGLIFEAGSQRATFLPSVWRQLPDAERFLRQLKRKAGVAEDYWSEQVRLHRYHSHSFSEGQGY